MTIDLTALAGLAKNTPAPTPGQQDAAETEARRLAIREALRGGDIDAALADGPMVGSLARIYCLDVFDDGTRKTNAQEHAREVFGSLGATSADVIEMIDDAEAHGALEHFADQLRPSMPSRETADKLHALGLPVIGRKSNVRPWMVVQSLFPTPDRRSKRGIVEQRLGFLIWSAAGRHNVDHLGLSNLSTMADWYLRLNFAETDAGRYPNLADLRRMAPDELGDAYTLAEECIPSQGMGSDEPDTKPVPMDDEQVIGHIQALIESGNTHTASSEIAQAAARGDIRTETEHALHELNAETAHA